MLILQRIKFSINHQNSLTNNSIMSLKKSRTKNHIPLKCDQKDGSTQKVIKNTQQSKKCPFDGLPIGKESKADRKPPGEEQSSKRLR